MIVADPNLLVDLLVTGDRTDAAEAARKRDPHWIAPSLWRSEFRNALSLYHRRQMLSLERAIAVAAVAEKLMYQREFPVKSASVLDLSARSGCSAYDCEFVALAQTWGVELVTSDEMILDRFPSTAVSLEAFTACGQRKNPARRPLGSRQS